MINLNNNLISWDQVEISTDQEVVAKRASTTFYAETTVEEKIGRFVNGMAFFIAGAKIVSLLPGVSPTLNKLGEMALSVLATSSLLQSSTLFKIISLASKILIVTVFIQAIRKVLAVIVWRFIYPVISENYEDQKRLEEFKNLTKENFECRRIALNISGIDYDTFAIEHPTTKGNGNWVIIAGGNGDMGERTLKDLAKKFQKHGFNTLYVNGPGVGRSTGFATSYSLGAGQEAGLQFLETVVRAKNIMLFGYSLGGGAQAEAIQSHTFKKGIHYMVWSHVTFDKLSNVASSMVNRFAKYMFFILGIEADCVRGAKRLQELGIRHLVVQNNSHTTFMEEYDVNGSDYCIQNHTSLYIGVRKANIVDQDRIKFYLDPKMPHSYFFQDTIEQKLKGDIAHFVANPVFIL